MLAPLLLLAASAAVDGEAALRHASKLAALGPHAWGSPRTSFAAEYVASQFRAAGLGEVRLEPFESHGIRGANVMGVLRASGPRFVLLAAHHDTAPESPGAYDDGGGVGVLLEVARVLARAGGLPRTIVFASFDGEEAWSTGKTTTAGSRAYLRSLGDRSRDLVAVVDVEMSGFAKGTPVLHTWSHPSPLSPGTSAVAPGWLVEAALRGSREAGSPLTVGDPLLSWIYQPAVRAFRVSLYGDDLPFLEAGLPAVAVSDSSFTAFYPWYHQPADAADKLDAAALARVGTAVVGAVRALSRAEPGPAHDGDWFAAGGTVVTWKGLLAAAVLSLLPGLLAARSEGGVLLAARLAHALVFGVLIWRHPIPALWVFLLPNMIPRWRPGLARRWPVTLGAHLPLLCLLGLAAAAWRRGMVSGLLVGPLDVALAGLGLSLLLV
ncbi:MAG TPA: M28 family peptidase, partial [Vicinamibacteria bacterium]